MIKPLFDTKTLNFEELIGNSKVYKVPRFQRSYSWEEPQWEDLWQDILLLKKAEEEEVEEKKAVEKKAEESVHYLGNIVLQTEDNKTFIIIDGQQRMVTLSILILGCLKLLSDLRDKGIEPEETKRG